MYLLNTSTLQLEQPRDACPKYAILSHVWGEEEVTFRDINGPDAVKLRGYAKIERCCAQALADGHKYAWVDTCCIDKSSSAELSEAINSMYRWYERAAVCYAYLADVPSDEDPTDKDSKFRHSRYFKRGWTLQEVIAPWRVEFFAMDWIKIGTKASEISVIAEVTGVDSRVLSKTLSLAEVSVAKKMSWASRRDTTRIEDRAYSLMGIFGVHLPLLYGEGANAFIRLQHEIVRTSNDQSIFAWGYDDQRVLDRRDHNWGRLFAPSPFHFHSSANFDRILPSDFLALFASSLSKDTSYKSHFSITNSGAQITLPVKSTRSGYTVALACVNASAIDSCFVWLNLSHDRDGILRRIGIGCAAKTEPRNKYFLKKIIIATDKDNPKRLVYPPGVPPPLSPPSRMNLDFRLAIREGFVLCTPPPAQGPYPLQPEDGTLVWNWKHSGVECILAFRNKFSEVGFIVTIGRWLRGVCVHVASVRNVDQCSGRDPLSVRPSPPLSSLSSHLYPFYSTSLPSNIDTGYDRPDHTLADGSRGCASAPDWTSRPLSLGKRATVSCLREWDSFNVIIAVGHPNVHRCVDENTQSQAHRLRTIQVGGVGLLEGPATPNASSSPASSPISSPISTRALPLPPPINPPPSPPLLKANNNQTSSINDCAEPLPIGNAHSLTTCTVAPIPRALSNSGDGGRGSESTTVGQGKRKEREGESDTNGSISDGRVESDSVAVVAPVSKKRKVDVVSDLSKSASSITSARRRSSRLKKRQTAERISHESRNGVQ
ncbi:HET-domain-containing protein [Leucogyrophana mollusca]|uniref:HET-domain-containing protein n=1 Tax=Leucogyrophana mollusca TaxID=85980 RepID=A0ACB8B594_9AGAM|nr:HET-domain-containing protein [Leucogyrophana mollusca]